MKKWIKNAATAVYRRCGIVLFYLFRIFPIKRNKIVVHSSNGMRYGDNARFLVEYLKKVRPDLDIVWLKAKEADFAVPEGIRIAPYRYSPKREYEMATAKVWLCTHFFSYFDRKRKGQFILQTWHGGMGIKKTGLDHEVDADYRKTLMNNGRLPDLMTSNCKHLTGVYRNGMHYEGEIMKCGYPRNDLFFRDTTEERKKVFSYYGLSEETKVLLYAPTYRPGHDDGINRNEDYGMDLERVKKALEAGFGGKWVVLVRWHPSLMAKKVSGKDFGDTAINVTQYPDMQELICAADSLISDYSTCLFDAALRRIPVFTFATDLEEYSRYPGIYYDMRSLPFAFAESMEELEENIGGYDQAASDARWEAFVKDQELIENGHATEEIAGRILKEMGL